MEIEESKILKLLEEESKTGKKRDPVNAVKNLMNATKRYVKEASVHLEDTGDYVRPSLKKATENYLKKELSKAVEEKNKIISDQEDFRDNDMHDSVDEDKIYQARKSLYDAFKLLDEVFYKMNHENDKKGWIGDIMGNILSNIREVQKFEENTD